jgi:hypothetical protein
LFPFRLRELHEVVTQPRKLSIQIFYGSPLSISLSMHVEAALWFVVGSKAVRVLGVWFFCIGVLTSVSKCWVHNAILYLICYSIPNHLRHQAVRGVSITRNTQHRP